MVGNVNALQQPRSTSKVIVSHLERRSVFDDVRYLMVRIRM